MLSTEPVRTAGRGRQSGYSAASAIEQRVAVLLKALWMAGPFDVAAVAAGVLATRSA
jgi:hypothetical protein